MYILFKEKLWLIIQATKLDLLLTFFVWFEIVINFQDETKNLAKFIHLKKNIYSKLIKETYEILGKL
jgi:hypothetical protein